MDRYRDFIAKQLNVSAPSADMEISKPKDARQFCLSAGTWLRDHTRDEKKFRILADERSSYGFRRNLLGLKPVALILNLLALLSCFIAMMVDLPLDLPALDSSGRLVTAVIAVVFHSALMTFFVTKDFVRQASQSYGIQLILCCESLRAQPTKLRVSERKRQRRLRRLPLHQAPRSKPPPPRHLPEAEFQNDPPRRLRRHFQRLRHHLCRDQRLCHHQLDQLRQF